MEGKFTVSFTDGFNYLHVHRVFIDSIVKKNKIMVIPVAPARMLAPLLHTIRPCHRYLFFNNGNYNSFTYPLRNNHMITNLIRKALAPSIEMILNVERIRLNEIINEMENAVDDVKSIRASDIADNINTYDIAQDISVDSYDIGRNIEIDASDIEVDTRDLAERISREIGGYIDIDVSDINIDYTSLARDIADYVDLNEVNARVNNVHTNLQTVERKMDLILKHLGITPENA